MKAKLTITLDGERVAALCVSEGSERLPVPSAGFYKLELEAACSHRIAFATCKGDEAIELAIDESTPGEAWAVACVDNTPALSERLN